MDEALKAQKLASEKKSPEVDEDEKVPIKRAKIAEQMHPEEQAAWNCFKDAIGAGVATSIEPANMVDLQMLTKKLLEALARAQEKQKEERHSGAPNQADAKMLDAAAQ